ncbi:iron ABC transporter permease [Microbacterium nanhaiense]|uniref:Iron ABC transporter permease n=1 Tax=Microbacterium nanhaiense TaxID=1301026 RepID=A0ABQ2N311_9MICO|nr:iron ABC transporter permease [Microbacterium nanhaiense]GGO63904.1 iron ABC transporter permease [Microbacterium nanhaiense]
MTQALQASKGRTSIAFAATAALLVASVVLSLAIGSRALSLDEIWRGLTGSDPVASAVIWQLRFPRTLLGLLVGAALGAAGVLAQAVTRNPLADPGLLGISSGAAVSIVAGTAFLGIGGGAGRMVLAVAGAALATLIVFAFASRSPEGLSPISMTLAGMAITACLGAVVSAIVLLDAESMDQYRFWQVGALSLPDPRLLWIGAAVALVGAIVAAAISGSLGALALGDDTASALGVKVGRTRVLAGAAVVLLSGMAVALAGPIGFIGLVIPHAARVFVGNDVRRTLALSALLGPLLLTVADIIGRVVVRPAELQVGVVTAVIGTPVFIWLTRRMRARKGA